EITLTELYSKLERTPTKRSTLFRGGMEWRKASTIGELVISGLVELEVTTDAKGDSTQKGFIEGALNIDTENSLLENLSISAKASFELKDDDSKSALDEIEMTIGISESFKLTTTYTVNEKILSISFENENPPSLTFGDMLTFIMKLADPYVESYRLDPPWDELNNTNLLGFLSDISLEFNFEKKTVALNIDYSANPKTYFGAVKVEKISLTAKQKVKPKGRRKYDVTIDFTGNFMGVSVGPERGQQLSWNVQDDSPASSPGKGTNVFELYYLLIGQRVAFNTGDSSTGVHTLTTMTAIDKRMVEIVDTISTGEIGDGIVFSRESKWMIASHFMVMEAVDAILIFNDPFLYGVRVRLLGKRAGKFEGLIFEILYRKINDKLGVYHTELTPPSAMRNMQMGVVKITLPSCILDIYTNGDFYFDVGFPHNGDFSRSAMVEYGYFT
ncbi:MAG: hypothetical protein K8I82_22900, partial [Anaerolineae bacterium]|nr:hypothetical protein [Anaerolineae bacterium]